MSHNKDYRKDKTCLNCRHVVVQKFCPNCGQENTNVRKTFYHLFVHFFEDLTHYENAFWRTIKNLIFKPAALTIEYLAGKRLSYLAPVRLYIFISFLTFFIVSFLPSTLVKFVATGDAQSEIKYDSTYVSQIEKIIKLKEKPEIERQKIEQIFQKIKLSKKQRLEGFTVNGYKSAKALDSLQKFGPEEKKINAITYSIIKKIFIVREHNSDREIFDKGLATAKKNIPKVLIIYMPFFAFFLWLFHSKKRWYYFDHGIFTLHYFSFLLLMFLGVSVLQSGLDLLIDHWVILTTRAIIGFVGFVWSLYYFFPAHRRFYGESKTISFVKSFFLFFINMFFIALLLTLFFIYTIINIH